MGRPLESRRAVAALLLACAVQAAPLGQVSSAFEQVASAERAFAARAKVVGWKQAFLEYFADDAVGFDGKSTGPAKDQIRRSPDPAKGAQLLWEPRFGDVAASGELGWLTGPSTSINPARNNGAPRHGNYASVWKRQPDGSFKVIMDVGVNQPEAVTFPAGLTRAPRAGTFTGATASATATLAEADRALLQAAATNQANAYRGRLAPGARLHRHDVPIRIGEEQILGWLVMQPAAPAAEHRFAEAARSGDLGYTWGTFPGGFYMRVWSRDAAGGWKVALDVVQ